MTTLRVILADDHALVRAGVRALLEAIEGVEVVGEAGDGHEALGLVEQRQPHIAILDIGLPGMNGVEVAARVSKEHPHTRVLILSMHDDTEFVRRALRAGVAGYLIKDSSATELELAVRAVSQGKTYLSPSISSVVIGEFLRGEAPAAELTPRQREILQLVAEGQTSKEIASRLNLAVKTVESHRSEIMARLGIRDTPGLVRYAIRTGLVSPER